MNTEIEHPYREAWEKVVWPDWIVSPPHILESVDSTNNYAGQLIREQNAPEGTLVIAESQTAGRGRRERTWFSPPGCSLYASIILRPDFPVQYAQIPTLLAASAAAAAIQHLYRLPAKVKWPNDIQIEGKKVGGILTESVLQKDRIDSLVVGIGLNCNLKAQEWPENLRPVATSLAEHLGHPVNRCDLFVEFLRIFGRDYRIAIQGDFQSAMRGWMNLNETLGKQITVQLPTGVIQGWAEALLPDGTLKIRESDTEEVIDIRVGEIS